MLGGADLSDTPEKMLLALWRVGKWCLKMEMKMDTVKIGKFYIRGAEKREAVPLKVVIEEVLIHMYCQGILSKSITQKIYNLLHLRSS